MDWVKHLWISLNINIILKNVGEEEKEMHCYMFQLCVRAEAMINWWHTVFQPRRVKTYTHTHIFKYTCIHIRMYTYVCRHLYMHIHMSTCVYRYPTAWVVLSFILPWEGSSCFLITEIRFLVLDSHSLFWNSSCIKSEVSEQNTTLILEKKHKTAQSLACSFDAHCQKEKREK